jgi:hypothetical protein
MEKELLSEADEEMLLEEEPDHEAVLEQELEEEGLDDLDVIQEEAEEFEAEETAEEIAETKRLAEESEEPVGTEEVEAALDEILAGRVLGEELEEEELVPTRSRRRSTWERSLGGDRTSSFAGGVSSSSAVSCWPTPSTSSAVTVRPEAQAALVVRPRTALRRGTILDGGFRPGPGIMPRTDSPSSSFWL